MSVPENSAPTLLAIRGARARLEGKFDIEESIEIQCELSGEMTVGDTLVIGRDGRVSADVRTLNAVIYGTYTGNLTASGSIEIASTGRVSGTLESDELVIAKGGVFTGTVARPDTKNEAQQDAGASGGALAEQQASARRSAAAGRAARPQARRQDSPTAEGSGDLNELADAPIGQATAPRLQSITLS